MAQQRAAAIEPDLAQSAGGVDAGTLGRVYTGATHSSRTQRRAGLVRRTLLAADVIGLTVAYIASRLVTGHHPLPPDAGLLVFAATLPLWIVAAKLFGLYTADELRIDHSTFDETVDVLLLVTLGSWLFVVAALLSHRPAEEAIVVFWVVALPAMMIARSSARAFFRRNAGFRQRALIVGADETGQLIARKLRHHPEYGVDPVGFVDADRGESDDAGDLALVGTPAQLRAIVQDQAIDRVVFACERGANGEMLAAIRSLSDLDVYVDVVPTMHAIVGPSGRIHSVEGLPLIGLPPVRLSRSSRLVKRSIDVVGAFVGMVLTAPLFLVVPILIRRESPGPALFRQERLGEHMREFTVLKFRTMRVGTDENAHRDYIRATMNAQVAPQSNGLYKLDRRGDVTRIGAFLRRTSLDELPQLVNVLRGEMSLVGPRPCIAYETQFFEPQHFERFLVPAGLTGLWQVTARGHATFGEALDMDVAYARGWSLGLDMTLILRTIRQVLSRKGTA